MKHAAIALLIIGLAVLPARTVRAQSISFVSISGHLDSDAPQTSAPGINIGQAATFEQLSSAAAFFTDLMVTDSANSAHTLLIYFFHQPPAGGNSIWRVQIYAFGADIISGAAGAANLVGVFDIVFDSNGVRTSVPTSSTPDFISTLEWNNGAAPAHIRFLFPFSQSPARSALTSIDGSPFCPGTAASGMDLNCDGIDEKVVWRPETGFWFISLSQSAGFVYQQWGLPNDVPFFGDYDGDRIPDLAVWRPSNGTWYVKRTGTNFSTSIVQQFGLPGDRPIRGDFDGDGKLDFAVWRPSNGNFYYLRSSDGLVMVEQWGLPGDIPLTAGRDSH